MCNYLITKLSAQSRIKLMLAKRSPKLVSNESRFLLGGRQCLLSASAQHKFGKQSSVLLHGFG